jgi:hypothetical protein
MLLPAASERFAEPMLALVGTLRQPPEGPHARFPV